MHRNEWRAIAELRMKEAQVLIGAHEPSGAYYLAGYAVECGLKACISRQFSADTVPDKRLVNSIYQHDLEKLVALAGLEADRRAEARANPDFETAWAVVKDWSEQARYTISTSADAVDLLMAVAEPQHGVLRWVKKHW